MKKITIDFVDFWSGFNKENNFIYNTLKKKYDVEISKNPEYVFCSLFGKEHIKYKKAIKILLIGENIAPDFNLYDYAIGFYDMNFDDRYLKYNILLDEDMIKLAERRQQNINEKFCVFVYSNGKLSKKRKEIFEKLCEYKKVDSGGKYLNNIGKRIGKTKQDKINFQKKYKFAIACENQSFKGYNTEKLLEAFASGCVPIYWGDPEINKIYNSKAFINCSDFKNIDELKEKIIEIDNDNKKYMKYLKEPVFNENFNYLQEQERLKAFLDNIISKNYEDAKKVKMSKEYFIYNYYKSYLRLDFIREKLIKIKERIKELLKNKI